MNRYNYLFVVLSISLLSTSLLVAGGKRKPEQSAITSIIQGMQVYEHMNNGEPATNWNRIAESIRFQWVNDMLKHSGAANPVQDHYVFMRDVKIPVPQEEKGDVVLIRNSPVGYGENGEKEGRYFISRYEGQLKFNLLPEDEVQEMLAAAGVKELPSPEPWKPDTNSAEVLAGEIRLSPESKPSERRFTTTAPNQDAKPISPSDDSSSPQPQLAETASSKNWLTVLVSILFGIGLVFFLWRRSRQVK